MFELILSTESKVLSTNIVDFEKQAEQYLATLTNTFETDDDFAKAKGEVKELKEIETKIRTVIKKTQNGEIANLIEVAEQIAERIRDARLNREKLVSAKEKEIKHNIISQALDRIIAIRSGYENDVSLALDQNISKQVIQQRLENAAKRRSQLSTLTKAINAEETTLIAEIGTEAARISARRKLIPIHYEYLFKDWMNLIAGTEDLEPIIKQRIESEEKREAEIKAKAEQEAKAKAEAEKVQAEAKAVADEMSQQSTSNNAQNAETDEPLADFIITVRLNQITQTKAIETARQLKDRFGDVVKLNQAK